ERTAGLGALRRRRWRRRRWARESFTIFSSVARVAAGISPTVARSRRTVCGARLRSSRPVPPPTTTATPSPAIRGASRPAPPIRLLTPSRRKLPIPSPPPSTEGTPTVSQRPRRRGTETAFEYGEWIFPSSGPWPAPAPDRRPAGPLQALSVLRDAPAPGREGAPARRAG